MPAIPGLNAVIFILYRSSARIGHASDLSVLLRYITEKGEPPLFAFRRFSRDGVEHASQSPEILDDPIILVIDGQQRLQT